MATKAELMMHAVKLAANRPHCPKELHTKLHRLLARRRQRAEVRAARRLARLREKGDVGGSGDGGGEWRASTVAAAGAECPDTLIDECVAELQGLGVVDDVAYATWHAQQRQGASMAVVCYGVGVAGVGAASLTA